MEGYGLRIWCLLRFASSRLSTHLECISVEIISYLWDIGKSVSYREIGELSTFRFLQTLIISFSGCKNIVHFLFQPLNFSFLKQMLRGWNILLSSFLYVWLDSFYWLILQIYIISGPFKDLYIRHHKYTCCFCCNYIFAHPIYRVES